MKANSTSDYTNMKKLALLLLAPLLLTSCSQNAVSLKKLKAHIDKIENQYLSPYYKVVGSIDLNSMITEISDDDGLFDQNPNGESYVAHARYNDGFYLEDIESLDEENTVIFEMASHSYWLRMPMHITRDNFYAEYEVNGEKVENPTCAHYMLEHLITEAVGQSGSINASTNRCYYEILSNGGFAVGGRNVRSLIHIDNYPYYMDYDAHPEMGEWEPDIVPWPCYQTEIDGRFNIRFEYDKDGWLVKETLSTSDYDVRKTTDAQVALRAVYTYKFGE